MTLVTLGIIREEGSRRSHPENRIKREPGPGQLGGIA